MDYMSPYSYRYNKDYYKDDIEARYFNVKETMWYVLTALTPQVKYNTSGGHILPSILNLFHVKYKNP